MTAPGRRRRRPSRARDWRRGRRWLRTRSVAGPPWRRSHAPLSHRAAGRTGSRRIVGGAWLQHRRPAPFSQGPSGRVLVAEALFLPGLGAVFVAVALPEAQLVVIEELQAADPLAALPEILLRDEHAERVAVLELQWLPPPRVRGAEPALSAEPQR